MANIMNKDELKEKVTEVMTDLSTDIDEYLAQSNVPIECYQKDLDTKLMLATKELRKIIEQLSFI